MSDDQLVFSSPSAHLRRTVRHRVTVQRVDSDPDLDDVDGMEEDEDEDDGTLVRYGPESDDPVAVQGAGAGAGRELATADDYRDSTIMDFDADDQPLPRASLPRTFAAQSARSASPSHDSDVHISSSSDRGTREPTASSAGQPMQVEAEFEGYDPSSDSEDYLPWPKQKKSQTPPLYRLGGSILVPIRDDSCSEALREVEERMAGQIARALHDPANEGLHSATFDTLIREFLLPRLSGSDRAGGPFALEQYSQLAALRYLSPLPLGKAETQERQKMRKEDEDEDIAARCIAAKDRRLPDMTAMVFFKETVEQVGGKYYLLTTRLGPKLAITEVKSINVEDVDKLHYALRAVLRKAHAQNERAAMWLFGEDAKLDHIASFVGAGPAWSYGEFDRFWYYDVHGKPWPETAPEVEDFEERDILQAHRKERKERDSEEREKRRQSAKKRRLPRSTRETSFTNSTFNDAEYDLQQETDPSSDSIDNAPTADGGVNEHRYAPKLGVHTPLPAAVLAPLFGGSEFLYVLDEQGRTRQAFDIIVERIRGWYKDRTDDYRLNFDADPHTP